MEENRIKNERSSIKEDIERLKLCSTNQCNICGRYEKEECMLERNRCEQHILSDYKRALKENEQLRTEVNSLKEIEQQHKTDNGLLRQELDMQIEHNKELEATLKQTQDSWFEDTQKLEQEKEKNKKLYEQNQLDIANADIVEKDKIIDLMENYMVENGWEICFDNIYAELNNCNGMERDWCRGDELEKKDIHKYFSKKLLESEE